MNTNYLVKVNPVGGWWFGTTEPFSDLRAANDYFDDHANILSASVTMYEMPGLRVVRNYSFGQRRWN